MSRFRIECKDLPIGVTKQLPLCQILMIWINNMTLALIFLGMIEKKNSTYPGQIWSITSTSFAMINLLTKKLNLIAQGSKVILFQSILR
jgi:hypothetical protein